MDSTAVLSEIRRTRRRFALLFYRFQDVRLRHAQLRAGLYRKHRPGGSAAAHIVLPNLPIYSFATTRAGSRRMVRRPWVTGGAGFVTVVPVTFRFPAGLAPGARRVSVVGSFNRWDPAVHPLRRSADNDWTITVYLSPGRVVYNFSVDGTTWLDPADDGRIPNGWGSEYSVRQIAVEPAAIPLTTRAI